MKRVLLATSAFFVCLPLFAIEVAPHVDKAIRESLPVCADATLSYEEYPTKLPTGFKGAVVKQASAHPACEAELVAVTSPTGGLFLGAPWLIEGEEGKTIEEKLKSFTWRNLQELMTPTVDRSALTEDGLYKVTLAQTTEAGPLPMYGLVDPQGRFFYFGAFRRIKEDQRTQRVKALDAFLPGSPTKGAAKPVVTIVEFSDFQCPSCKRSSGYVDPIVAKHPESVRYVRFDLPLTGHPWAFPAALAGRAIYRQKPELFWQFKHDVYEHQSDLNAFMFWDWARNWAEDHDLELAKYDADLASAELKKLILEGAGAALSNDVRATPTYMVNGSMIDPGTDAKDLAEYVEKLLAAK
ncbi:MAG TPA: thioredoxin domain-containing protein [Thermoanaerobaculia bacterium]|nr:thioredoxin domain-containing protein [Thermoanaerobaculia bacterium]